MAFFTWPVALPQAPMADKYKETHPDQVLKTSMDKGPALRRRKCSSMPYKITATFLMSKSQLAIFESFVMDSLAAGTYLFEWTHPLTGAAIDCALVGDGSDLYTVATLGSAQNVSVDLTLLVYP